MIKKEILLSTIVLVGLALTISSFYQEKSYDCTQSLFSTTSSCSLVGGSCVDMQAQAGISGLWDHFTGFEIEHDHDGFTIKCSPDCFIKFNSGSQSHKKDSVSYVPIEPVQ